MKKNIRNKGASPKKKVVETKGFKKAAPQLPDVSRYGLNAVDAATLGLALVDHTPPPKAGLQPKTYKAIRIPYTSPFEDLGDYARFRLLGHAYMRYIQPPDTLPMVYYSPLIENWQRTLKDTATPLIITEGEFKASCACKNGFTTIALGGVWSFKSSKRGIELLEDLAARIEWNRRTVYIAYDSDATTNSQVCAAMLALANCLIERGAEVYNVVIPPLLENGKTGLDDYLLHKKGGVRAFKKLLRESLPIQGNQAMYEYNASYIYIRNPNCILQLSNQAKIKPAVFKTHYDTKTKITVPTAKGLRDVPVAPIWLAWHLRSQAEGFTYRPDQAPLTIDRKGLYNVFEGFPMKPVKGDVSKFHTLIDNICGHKEDEKHWFMCWLAYPLQHPATKQTTAVLVQGNNEGTGKSMLGKTMRYVYGNNYILIAQERLFDRFNMWAEGKLFVHVDDMHGIERYAQADALKRIITQDVNVIEYKGMDVYSIPDYANYYLTSNRFDVLKISDRDRRFFVLSCETFLSPQFFREYAEWLPEGAAYILDYLLSYDCGDYSPFEKPPVTEAKKRIESMGESDLYNWIRSEMLDTELGDLCAMADIKREFDAYNLRNNLQSKYSMIHITKEMRRAGFEYWGNEKKVRIGKETFKVVILRQKEKWEQADIGKVQYYFQQSKNNY